MQIRLSNIIAQRIRYNVGRPRIQENKDICCFPVKNILDKSNGGTVDLMTMLII